MFMRLSFMKGLVLIMHLHISLFSTQIQTDEGAADPFENELGCPRDLRKLLIRK